MVGADQVAALPVNMKLRLGFVVLEGVESPEIFRFVRVEGFGEFENDPVDLI